MTVTAGRRRRAGGLPPLIPTPPNRGEGEGGRRASVNGERGLTVKERKEEKRVPSSYLEILASTPSRMTTNWGRRADGRIRQGIVQPPPSRRRETFETLKRRGVGTTRGRHESAAFNSKASANQATS